MCNRIFKVEINYEKNNFFQIINSLHQGPTDLSTTFCDNRLAAATTSTPHNYSSRDEGASCIQPQFAASSMENRAELLFRRPDSFSLRQNSSGSADSPASCNTPFNSMVHIPDNYQKRFYDKEREKEKDDCEMDRNAALSDRNAVDYDGDTEDGKEKTSKDEEEAETHRTSLGFYVDLSEVEEPEPPTVEATAKKKNIFSMVSVSHFENVFIYWKTIYPY